jgi:hypothetical protein
MKGYPVTDACLLHDLGQGGPGGTCMLNMPAQEAVKRVGLTSQSALGHLSQCAGQPLLQCLNLSSGVSAPLQWPLNRVNKDPVQNSGLSACICMVSQYRDCSRRTAHNSADPSTCRSSTPVSGRRVC